MRQSLPLREYDKFMEVSGETAVRVFVTNDAANTNENIVSEVTAVGNMSALKLVRAASSDSCIYAEKSGLTEATVLGITLNSANNGQLIKVCTFGKVYDPFFNFPIPVNSPLFLGDNGTISFNPSSGWHTIIGKYLGEGAIMIDVQTPIYRS